MSVFTKEKTTRYTPNPRDGYGQFTSRELVLVGSPDEIVIKKQHMEEIPLTAFEAKFVIESLRDWLVEE